MDDVDRQVGLRELLVLDSLPEPVFDSIARLAAEVCGTPIAVLSLVDDDRVWIKASVGLTGISEVPRARSFCSLAINAERIFEVHDATSDPRFSANSLVTGEARARFYAGAPLVLPGGERVGMLSVVDNRARRLDEAQTQTLCSLAAVAIQALVMRRDLIAIGLSARDGGEKARRASQQSSKRTGIRTETLAGVSRQAIAPFTTPGCVRNFADLGESTAETSGIWNGETTLPGADGREVPVNHGMKVNIGLSDDIECCSPVMRDIPEETQSKQQVQRQTAILRSVAEAIPAIVAVVGSDGRFRFANRGFEDWFGVRRETIIGQTMLEVLGEAEFERSRPWVERVLDGEPVNFEKYFPERIGARHLGVSFTPLLLENNSVDGFVAVGQNITQHKLEAERLLQLTQRDALTGLLNRAGFDAQLERRLRESGGPTLALLFIDLDHFKSVNDRHGHGVGDQVLRLFAQRLQRLVRPSDAVARLGGDEFAVLMSGVRASANTHDLADKVIAAAASPFDLGRHLLQVGASVGVAFGADPALGCCDLLERADAMLYRAKETGRGRQAGAAL